jgi:PAS domain S-box-containing protein
MRDGKEPQDDLFNNPVAAGLEALFDHVPDIVFFIKDRDARYVVVNQTLVERLGLSSKNALLGKTVLDLFPSPMGKSYHEQDLLVLDEGVPVRDLLELHLYVQGEAGWCVTNKAPLRSGDGDIAGLVGLSKDIHVPAREGTGYSELAASVQHIQKHYGESLRVKDLARMSSMSPYQFEHRMKRIFQLTAGQFITKTRIETACELLRNTGTPIARVATDCGFHDQSAFARQFKATTGLTPTDYRVRMK